MPPLRCRRHLCCGYERGHGPASISYALLHILVPVAFAIELTAEMQDGLPDHKRRQVSRLHP
jgi:hypothetical protein